jgi:hypothetical protein
MDQPRSALQPLPYQRELKDYLKTHERELWDWFSSSQARLNYTDTLRLDLLKSTYRLDTETHAELYRVADEAKAALELNIPLTIYQSQHGGSNATLYYIPGEGHIVFSGPLLSLLASPELKSVIAHELAHYVLWQEEVGEYLIADRLLQTIAHDYGNANSHIESARLFQLYTEIYADRGSYYVTRDLNVVISSLVKTETGIQQVSATGYLKQAEEIFSHSKVATEELSHPEAFMRARSLALWADQRPGADEEIVAMIEGDRGIERLDLLSQVRLTAKTRSLLSHFLAPKWFQTDAVLGHAKMFFADFKPAKAPNSFDFASFKTTDRKLREYYSYLLLDFVVADPELNEMPLAAAIELSRLLDIDGEFERLVAKELKVKARELAKIKNEAANMLKTAETSS